ncbi:MAG: polysaccharide biosynthesis tyrosine autokinase [Acidobacteriota bacterium]
MSKRWESFEEPASAETATGPVDLSEYWAIIAQRWRLIAVCVVLALGVAAIQSFRTEPLYRATVLLAVEKDNGGSMDIRSIEQTGSGYDPDFLPTQIRLMRSRDVAERVVTRLNLANTATSTAANPARRSGFFRPGGAPADKAAGEDATTAAASRIASGVGVDQVRGTNLVELTYISNSPAQAAEIANAVADAYIEWTLDAKFGFLKQTSQFLGAQIRQLKGELDAREQDLTAYGRQKDIVSSDPRSNPAMQNLDTLNVDYSSALADRVAKEARYHQLATATADSTAEVSNNPVVSQLRGEQARLEREYAEKLNLFKPEWPAMLQLKAQIEKGRQHLEATVQDTLRKNREAARGDYETALRREGSLKGVLRSQRSEALTANGNVAEYGNLRLEVDTKRALMDNLLKRQAEVEVLSRMRGERVSGIRVVDRALAPHNKFKPSYSKNALVGLLVGLSLGVGLAFLLSYLDRSLRTPEQVEQYLHVPALGVIPSVSSPGRGPSYGGKAGLRGKPRDADDGATIELLPHHRSRSRIAERYRAFRTALLLSWAGGIKSIVITSAISREGKTSTAANLAVVLGQLGKRVLLVDADLHRPRLHEVLRVSNRVGLVSILAENLDPERAVQMTSVPDVFIVPAGPTSPNPSGLLSSDAMGNFLEFARLNYDYVILDGPPVIAVADAIVLGHQTDGVVLCVKGGATSRDAVIRSRDKLMRSGVRVLGVVINNLAEDAAGYGKKYGYEESYYAGEIDPPVPEPAGGAAAATRLS